MCVLSSSPYRGPKLRILDLRQDPDCGTTCSEISTTFPFCFQSCVYSQHSILKTEEAQHNVKCLGIVNSESEPPSTQKPVELLVDLSFNGTLRTKQFLSFLQSKVEQSFGSLHLCCRDLQINKISAHKSVLQFLDLGCIDHLELNQAYLNEVTTLLAQMIHLNSISLSNISFKRCKGEDFRTFLIQLGQLHNLQELSLALFCLTDQLHKLLRWRGGEEPGFPEHPIVKTGEETILRYPRLLVTYFTFYISVGTDRSLKLARLVRGISLWGDRQYLKRKLCSFIQLTVGRQYEKFVNILVKKTQFFFYWSL